MSDFDKDAGIAIEIGGMPIFLRTADPSFRQLLESRHRGFLNDSGEPRYSFDIDLGSRYRKRRRGTLSLKLHSTTADGYCVAVILMRSWTLDRLAGTSDNRRVLTLSIRCSASCTP